MIRMDGTPGEEFKYRDKSVLQREVDIVQVYKCPKCSKLLGEVEGKSAYEAQIRYPHLGISVKPALPIGLLYISHHEARRRKSLLKGKEKWTNIQVIWDTIVSQEDHSTQSVYMILPWDFDTENDSLALEGSLSEFRGKLESREVELFSEGDFDQYVTDHPNIQDILKAKGAHFVRTTPELEEVVNRTIQGRK